MTFVEIIVFTIAWRSCRFCCPLLCNVVGIIKMNALQEIKKQKLINTESAFEK